MGRFKKIIPVLLFFAAVSAGCGKENGNNAPVLEKVEVAVSMGLSVDESGVQKTRVTVDGSDFEDGDKFRFFFNADRPDGEEPAGNDDPSAAIVKRSDYIYSGNGKWMSGNPLYWDDNLSVLRSFCAVMPFNGYNTAEHSFTVAADQSTETYYKSCDLLMARVYTAKRRVPLEFNHIMSRITVSVSAVTDNTNENGWFDADAFEGMTVKINGIMPKASFIYGLQGADEEDLKITVASSGTNTDIDMLCIEEPVHKNKMLTAKYAALIPEQTIPEGSLFLTFTLTTDEGLKTYHLKVAENLLPESGKETLVRVKLLKNKVEITEANADISLEDWGTVEARDGDDNPIKLTYR